MINAQAIGVVGKELLHGFAGMVTRAILDDNQRLAGFGQHLPQEGLITGGVKATGMGFVKESAREIINQAKDFVGFALAAGPGLYSSKNIENQSLLW